MFPVKVTNSSGPIYQPRMSSKDEICHWIVQFVGNTLKAIVDIICMFVCTRTAMNEKYANEYARRNAI